VRFGYAMGDEARRKLLSFRNIFTFFDTYASIDHPRLEGDRPALERLTVMDRWLLLRTNEFIETATQLMDEYRNAPLVKEFEAFTEDISNWYIRLNRRRFWKSEDRDDQMAAYYSLYFALKTCVQVMSPIIPFMTEHIWQALVRQVEPGAPLSVHLSDWPQPLPWLEKDGLLEQTTLTREVVATALRLRNEQQLKVRQPLQTLFICGGTAARESLLRFERQLLDELNVKELRFLDDPAALQVQLPGVNFKSAGAVLKSRVNEFKTHLSGLSDETAQAVAAQVNAGGGVSVPGWEETLPAALFTLQTKTKPGVVSTKAVNGEVTVALDTVLTEELRREGAVRDVIRQCQTLRKDAGYAVEQRVSFSAATSSRFLTNAIQQAQAHIDAEVLAAAFRLNLPLADPDLTRTVDIAGEPITLCVSQRFECPSPSMK
jgi:isoleucyl-tRNA synthetase